MMPWICDYKKKPAYGYLCRLSYPVGEKIAVYRIRKSFNQNTVICHYEEVHFFAVCHCII